VRIALINKDFDASFGGGEVYATQLALGLAKRGHEVALVARRSALAAPGLRWLRVDVPGVPRHRRVVAFRDAAAAVVAAEAPFDIVHALTQYYPADIHRCGGGVFRHWETVTQPHPWLRALVALGRRNRTQRALERLIYDPRHVRFVQTNSLMVKAQVEHYYQLPSANVIAIPNGVDLVRFNLAAHARGLALRAQLGIPATAPVVLFVGNNARRKGLRRLGAGLAALASGEQTHLIVAGAAPRRQVERAIAKHRGPRWIVGGQNDIVPYYGAADVLAILTRYDPFANVTLEALACGVPVLSSRENGAGELLVGNQAGCVVADADAPQQVASALGALLDARGPATRQAARDLAERYPWERNIEAVLALYQQVLADRERSATPPSR
jgi:UDP-glucose:(heptosyl)LPS alpha-1,3-glucosyltransferase